MLEVRVHELFVQGLGLQVCVDKNDGENLRFPAWGLYDSPHPHRLRA